MEKQKMSKKELVKLIIENFSDEHGNVNLSSLNFYGIKGNVYITGIKVPNSLYISNTYVNKTFYANKLKCKDIRIDITINLYKQIKELKEYLEKLMEVNNVKY